MASGCQPRDLKHNRPKKRAGIKERRKETASTPVEPVKDIDLIKKAVRKIARKHSIGMCLPHSLLLYSVLVRLGEHPKLIGIYNRHGETFPEHFIVYCKEAIDIFPEGYKNEWKVIIELNQEFIERLYYAIRHYDWLAEEVLAEMERLKL